MAGKAMKRAKSGGPPKKFAKKCAVIAPAIKQAASLPQPVRSIIGDRLVHVFGTYKEERHPFQKTCVNLVGTTLKSIQSDLQKSIADASATKGAAEAEGATFKANHDNLSNAAAQAAQAAADAKTQLENCRTGLKDAKQHLEDAKTAVKTLESDTSATAAKKEKLEALIKEFFVPVKEGTLDKGLSKSAAYAGRHLGKEFSDTLESEFITCVGRTYSKAASAWGTFDHIVEKELDKQLKRILASLEAEMAGLAGQKDPRANNVEAAKAGVGAADEKVKAAIEASTNAAAAAKEAKAASKTATDSMNHQQKSIEKADDVLQAAESKLAAFQAGALAAFTEVEAHTAPPPAPEKSAETAPLEQAMQPTPAAAPQSQGMLPSPSVLLSRAAQAVGLGASPRVAASPRAAA